MNHEKKLRNSTVWLLIAVMALSMLSVLSACKATEQDMHVPAEIMRNPETPLVYPGESFVPTPVPTVVPTVEPEGVFAVYDNGYDCYYDQLRKLLNGEKLEHLDMNATDPIGLSICRNDGNVFIFTWPGAFRPWGEKGSETVFTFPNPDIWYDIFPPGEKIADSLVTPEDWHYHKGDADAEIMIPEYNQEADGSWRVIFGGDWMVVYMPWGLDDSCYMRFKGTYDGYSDWRNSPLAQYAHTCILRTDDNWKTWERWDSSGADAIASHELYGAHISSNGVGYISYKRWSNHYNAGVSFINDQGTYELMMTHDGGKSWELITEKNAVKFGLPKFLCHLSPSYFEGLHGIAVAVIWEGHYPEYHKKLYERLFIESFDGGLTWEFMDADYDFDNETWYLKETVLHGNS